MGSISVGAWPTPGTVTSSPFGSASTILCACRSDSTSLSLPQTTRVGAWTRASAGHSGGRGGGPVRTRCVM